MIESEMALKNATEPNSLVKQNTLTIFIIVTGVTMQKGSKLKISKVGSKEGRQKSQLYRKSITKNNKACNNKL